MTTKVAIAGAGYFSAYHLDGWQRLDGVEVCGILDPDRDRASRLVSGTSIPTFASLEQLLNTVRPDVLDIVTPPETHAEIALAAAQRNIDVIVQKPLAPSWDEAVQLVEALGSLPVRFMVHENWRWQPWYRAIKSLSDDGTTGRLFGASFRLRTGDGWQPDAYVERQPYFRFMPRLLLHETGIHLVDTFRFLLGEVETVHAITHRRNAAIAGEDEAIVVLEFVDGATAVLDASRYNEPDAGTPDPRYTFGTARIDAERGHFQLPGDGQVMWKALGEDATVLLPNPPRIGFAGDSVHALQAHFLKCRRDGTAFEAEGDDYLRSVAVVEACYEAARSRRPTRVAY
ncbi:putative dehydrogenase [Ilumatobacter fluminis]|uniref:Putative dehydrogenase n=1 Tax=Ilumatobacter fluminis TaxID=467091 RepID=A0A4R7HWH3_9ACTN|nr:Gfo/Idh/MocA family oxidoreductase [Ilumatobacter fluminis]TDT14894.1 putative dehydrogenase [Ilumatobacter fluminis]